MEYGGMVHLILMETLFIPRDELKAGTKIEYKFIKGTTVEEPGRMSW